MHSQPISEIMRNDNLEIWWSSLTIAQKERIARKGQTKASPDGKVDEALVRYPACTRWWNAVPDADKQKIHGGTTTSSAPGMISSNRSAPASKGSPSQ